MSKNQISPKRNCRAPVARWVIQDRDISFWVRLYHNTLLTRDQAIRFGEWGSISRFNTRIVPYLDGSYVRRHRLPFQVQSGYSLGSAACGHVAAVVGLDAETVRRQARVGESIQFVEHTVKVVDVQLALVEAAQAAGIPSAWKSERQVRHVYRIRRGEGTQEIILKPDGYLRLSEGSTALHAFIEVDMSHRSLGAMKQTMAGYVRYAASVFPETYHADEFVVLCVVPGRLRISHLREAARQTGASMFRFTTYDQLFSDGPLARIWTTPDDGDALVSLERGVL